MQVRLTLRQGQKGTAKALQRYRNRLIAVRYRYDGTLRMRLKAVELLEEQMPWVQASPKGQTGPYGSAGQDWV